MRRGATLVAVVGVVALTLSACAAGPNTAAVAGPDAPGFWLGLWHGVILPIAFVVSLFDNGVSIYEIHNNGGWYDLGFLLGICVPVSGPASSRRAVSSRSRSART
jgi:hypothetical protein